MKKALLLCLLMAAWTLPGTAQTLYDDFEGAAGGTRIVTYANQTGTLVQNQMNPAASAANTSATCARYTRNAGVQYDNFDIEAPRTMADVTPYVGTGGNAATATKHMTMKFYSPSPGTQVLLVLQNKAKNRSGGYPAGKLLGEFTATTTLTNAWETLTFNFAYVGGGNFDPTVTVTTVDEITVLFAPNSFLGTVYHFDDVNGPELTTGTASGPAGTQLFDTFEDTRGLRFTQVDGTFTPGTDNPSVGASNTSATVGQYVRSANQYDTFEMAPLNITFFDDVAGLASGAATIHPTMKLYSTAPIGTTVQFVFANAATTTSSNYPTGRHSIYTATTTSSTGWQTLTFNYLTSPDPSVKSTAVDRIQLQINPGNAVPGTFYFDDITLPEATIPVARLYENFNDTRNLTYGARDGVLTEQFINPATTGINPNPGVGKYVRSSNQYDTFYAKLPTGATMDDITDFTTGVRKLTMRVYSPEPTGSGVTLTLTDDAATPSNYPTGRHSYYYTTTTAQNAWQTLTFTLQATLNPGMDKVHHLTGVAIQFAGGTTTTGTWYFDQLYGPNFTVAPGALYEDFELSRKLTYTLTNSAALNQSHVNAAVFGENYSATAGRYSRSAVANDVLIMTSAGKQLDDVTAYASAAATQYFYLKVYSNSIGTSVALRLQNAAKAGTTGTFTGTQSVYMATTTKSNQWETLRFAYQTAIAGVTTDASVSATQVDQLALAFNPGSTTAGQTFDFDFFVGQALITAAAPPAGAAVTQLYDDFETTRQLRLLQADGTFTPGTTNPSVGASNTSATVGQYVRSANQYDTFEVAPANATFFDDVAGFASGAATVKPSMKIYSTAPIGTTVQLVFANAATTTSSNYPTGRHSIYTATTTSSTGWQTLSFTYATSPDPSVKSTAVDRVQLQINPGNAVPGTFYFDDITLPAATIPVARLYENFNNVRSLTYGTADGVLTQQAANPSTTGINANPLVGKYVRSTTQYDTFYAALPGTADDVTDFFSGTRQFSMRVYSPEAVGTGVTVTFTDATATPSNYPTGRPSVYLATTTVQNGWQVLTFNYLFSPTGGNNVRSITGIAVQFDGGNPSTGTWYFDQIYGPNFTVYDASGTKAPGTLYDDFDNAAYRQMTYSSTTGTLTQVASNPAIFGENYSAKVGRYMRSASANDIIKMVPTGGKKLNNVSTYASATPTQYFYLKLFSKTIGTPVKLLLQNTAKAIAAYPNSNGTQSAFSATTTKSNQWELLKFVYQAANPGVTTDASVSVNQVNQLLLLFNPGSTTASQRFDFDFLVGQDLLLATGLTWNGSISSDWNDGDNWSGGVAPVAVSGAPATIPGGLSRYPILTTGSTYGSPDIIINAGGSLTQTGGTFNLANGVTNNGTYTQTGGITNLAGAGSHVFGNGTPMTFYDLNVGTGGAVFAGGPLGTISVSHRMVVGGNVTTNDHLILLSSATGTAIVVNRNGATVSGNTTVQRYVSPALFTGPGYHHFASSVTGATVADLHGPSGAAPVVNANYNASLTPYSLTPLPTVFTYDEQRLSTTSAITSGFDYGWKCPTLSDPLVAGRGYTVRVAPTTVSLTGVLRTGNQAVVLSKGALANSGWQFLGNPYASVINWDSLAKPSGVDDALYVFRSNSSYGGFYTSYVNGVSSTPGANLVASGQGFFTRVNTGTPTFTFTNAARLVNYSSPVQYRGTADARPRLDLRVQGANGQNDILCVYQEAGASTSFDAHFDALKVILNGGQQPTIYQQSGSESLSIQGLAAGSQAVALPLGISAPAAGTFTFSAQQLANFPATAAVAVEDIQTGIWHDLRAGSFTVTLPQGLQRTRFVLHLYQQRALATASSHAALALQAYPNPVSAGTVVRLTDSTKPGAILDLTGRVVGHFAEGKVSTSALAPGLYLLRESATGRQAKLMVQ